ncbi:MAG: MFS transporter, partial [Actinomycetota bacterium]|nr:MFS transporter [Actinomycetota bacterium]
ATIQEHVPEHTRTSVFGRSETLIQLSWVVGGGLGVALPTDAGIGMGAIAVVMVLWLLLVLRGSQSSPVSAGPVRRT